MTAKVKQISRYCTAGRAYVPFYASVVADLLKVIGGDARSERCSSDIQYLSRQFGYPTHCILSLGV